MLHAQALCREFGVRLLLLDSDAFASPDQPVLWVDSRAPWAQCEMINQARQLWRVDAGVPLASLRERGIGIFADMTAEGCSDWTLSQWFASAKLRLTLPGNLADMGVVQAQLLLADGTCEQLGPFGAASTAPLKSLAVQRMIPKIFELAQSEEASACARVDTWPMRYRLDAMMPQFGESPNLAWLFQGHGGSLAWLQALWLERPIQRQLQALKASTQETPSLPIDATTLRRAAQLDHAVKLTFDPTGLFGEVPGPMGLESPQVQSI